MITSTIPTSYVKAVKSSGLSIYDPIEVGDPDLWIPSHELENILNKCLIETSLKGLLIRTRSKVVKEKICSGLGYPIIPIRKNNCRYLPISRIPIK
jgi:hypothetical protein